MTDPAYVAATRAAYDTVAVDYEALLRDELAGKPVDRAILGVFAELVTGDAVDVGCGPGRITGYLANLGVHVSGIDLSPGMIEVARAMHPDIRFEVGSMLELARADESLAGLVAWYSIIHVPPADLPTVFAQFARVLEPGGLLLLAFQVGDEPRHLEHGYGHEISLDAWRLRPDAVIALATDAGFTLHTRIEREPESLEKTPQGYLLLTKSL